MSLPQRLPLEQMQVNWAQQLDPIIANAILKGNQLNGIQLSVGTNTINHKLQRAITGYLVTSMYTTFSQIVRGSSSTPSLTLVLNSSAATTVDLYVY